MKTPAAGKSFSLAALLRAFRRHKLYVVIPVLLTTSAAYFYARRLPERYRTRALVAAEAPETGVLSDRIPPAVNVQEQLRDIRETLLGQPLLEGVIREFNLYDLTKHENIEPAIAAMKSRIQLQVEGADAFYIGFEGDGKEQVKQVADSLASRFVDRMQDLRGQRVEHQDSFLDAEVERMRKQLNQEEDGLRAYRQSAAAGLPEFLAANLKQVETLDQQIQAKTDKITEAETRRSTLNEQLKSLDKARVLEDEPAAPSPSEIALADARTKLKQVQTRYTPENPEVKRAQALVRDLEASVVPSKNVHRAASQVQLQYFTLQAELKSIDPTIAVYKQEREALTAQKNEAQRKVNSSPGFESSLAGRMHDVDATRLRYQDLVAKQQQAKLSQRAEKTDIGSGPVFHLAEPAPLPAAPYSPKRLLIVLFGLLGGLGAGIAFVLIGETMNDTFATSEEFESSYDFPVLASVPSIPPARPIKPVNGGAQPFVVSEKGAAVGPMNLAQHRLPMLTDPQSVASQQYGILALKVCHWLDHNQGRVVAVTSSAGEEGKSVTALNLALALAASSEEPVLLVDCDLRLPQVKLRLGLKGEKGLSDLLALPQDDYHSYISKIGNLHVIAGGAPPQNPVGLLASRRARELFETLRREYRLIILDSPPIVPIADTHILAGLSDAVLLVVRARKTKPALFQRAVENLDAPNVIGVVLNDVEYSDTPYAYAYRYYQQHYLGRS